MVLTFLAVCATIVKMKYGGLEISKFKGSAIERAADIAGARILQQMSKRALALLMESGELDRYGLDPLFTQERIGRQTPLSASRAVADMATFTVSKFTTMIHVSENEKLIIGPVAERLRTSGYDEAIQYQHILNGEMSLFGHRPRTPQDLEEIYDLADNKTVDAHRKYVLPTNPGIFGTASVEGHTITAQELTPTQELDHEIKDATGPYFTRNVRTGLRLLQLKVSGNMTDNRNGQNAATALLQQAA